MSLSFDMPKVSILMPALNVEKYLAAAIESVLGQTLRNFELLLIDDNSSDKTAEIAASFKDPRIQLIPNTNKPGLASCLNQAMRLANGQYLARMDADDLCHPERLMRQVQFLDINRDIDVLGTHVKTFGDAHPETLFPPITHEAIRARMIFAHPPLAHATLMMRRRRFEEIGLQYDDDFPHAEDHNLHERGLRAGLRYHNLADTLYLYRRHSGQVSLRLLEQRAIQTECIRARAFCAAGIELLPAELALLHRALSPQRSIESYADFVGLSDVFGKIKSCGQSIARLDEELAFQWFLACYRHTHLGPKILALHATSKFKRGYWPPPVKYLKFNYRAFSRSV